EPWAIFKRMGILIVAAIELHAPDGTDIVGLLHRCHKLVGVGGPCSLDGVCDYVNIVVGGIAVVGRRNAVALDVGFGKRDCLRGECDAGRCRGSGYDALGRSVSILPEGTRRRLRTLASHRNGHLLVMPLHGRLYADMTDAGGDDIGMFSLDLAVDWRKIARIWVETDVVKNLESGFRQAFQIARVQRDG